MASRITREFKSFMEKVASLRPRLTHPTRVLAGRILLRLPSSALMSEPACRFGLPKIVSGIARERRGMGAGSKIALTKPLDKLLRGKQSSRH